MTTTQRRRKRTMTTKTMKDPHSPPLCSSLAFPSWCYVLLQCRLQFSGRLRRFGLPELRPLPKLMLLCFASALSSVWRSQVDAMLRFAATVFGGSATVCGSAFSSWCYASLQQPSLVWPWWPSLLITVDYKQILSYRSLSLSQFLLFSLFLFVTPYFLNSEETSIPHKTKQYTNIKWN